MKFTPMKKTERSALANHTDWKLMSGAYIRHRGIGRRLIACTCHKEGDPKADLRWVNESQLPMEAEPNA